MGKIFLSGNMKIDSAILACVMEWMDLMDGPYGWTYGWTSWMDPCISFFWLDFHEIFTVWVTNSTMVKTIE